jgi:C-terminal binding protein
MPRGSILVNTARGGVVDPLAVLKGLESGILAGAAIDVLEQEPPAADHPLVSAWRDPQHPAHDRLILTPHAAFYSEEGLLDMRIKGSQNCLRALTGATIRNVVNA